MIKRIKIMQENWDYLIILDACRYDYFSKLYRNHFVGKLEKVISLASSTHEWCMKSFSKLYDDVVYISANPYINSKMKVREFVAKEHFHRIIDVWDWGWNEQLGTVHPEQVNKAMLTFRDKYPNKRFIIHYLQPHEPYFAYKPCTAGFPQPQISDGELHGPHGFREISENHIKNVKVPKIINFGLYLLQKLTWILAKGNGPLGGFASWRVREILNLPPANPMDSVRRKMGNSGLRQAYVANLRLVLRYVATLTENLSGITVITSDHGERLGEGGRYSHADGLCDSLLLEIPWFTVEKVLKRKDFENAEKKRVKRRIKELKASNNR